MRGHSPHPSIFKWFGFLLTNRWCFLIARFPRWTLRGRPRLDRNIWHPWPAGSIVMRVQRSTFNQCRSSEILDPLTIDFRNLRNRVKCPYCNGTGHFTFLPIHAAGNYGEQAFECAADYFISLYTPTCFVGHRVAWRHTRVHFYFYVKTSPVFHINVSGKQ